MWRISGRDDEGRSRELRFAEIETSSRTAIRGAVREVMGGETSEVLEREMESPDPLPGLDGIESWGATAAQLFGPDGAHDVAYGQIGTAEDGRPVPGLFFNDVFGTASMAYHSPEAVVADVTGVRELEISSDHEASPPQALFTLTGSILESRVYGDGTVIEAEAESEPGTNSFRVSLPGNQRGFVARFANWLARPFTSPGDPFVFKRLRYYEQRYPVIANHYPDISLAATTAGMFRAIPQAPAHTAVIIFVHGTYSCAIPNLALLHPLKLPAYRFEHDTFLPVASNKDFLVQAVLSFIPRGIRVYFIAHSRGGLVSRLAARQLRGNYDVHVMTYGTPHCGTPLANMGKRVFSALLSSGRAPMLAGGAAAVSSVFSWDPPSLAGKLLLKGIVPSGFPPGLDDMRPGAGLMAGLAGVPEPFLMRTWGAQCDVDNLPSGAFTFALRDAIQGAFSGAANDTVVGLGSATGAGAPQPVLAGCTHFEYFARTEVRQEIQSLA
jgi:hypothetical protein